MQTTGESELAFLFLFPLFILRQLFCKCAIISKAIHNIKFFFYRLFRSDSIRTDKLFIRHGGGTKRRDTSSHATKDFNRGQPPSLAASGAGVTHAGGTGWLGPLPS